MSKFLRENVYGRQIVRSAGNTIGGTQRITSKPNTARMNATKTMSAPIPTRANAPVKTVMPAVAIKTTNSMPAPGRVQPTKFKDEKK